jgi:hypothetical protein
MRWLALIWIFTDFKSRHAICRDLRNIIAELCEGVGGGHGTSYGLAMMQITRNACKTDQLYTHRLARHREARNLDLKRLKLRAV